MKRITVDISDVADFHTLTAGTVHAALTNYWTDSRFSVYDTGCAKSCSDKPDVSGDVEELVNIARHVCGMYVCDYYMGPDIGQLMAVLKKFSHIQEKE